MREESPVTLHQVPFAGLLYPGEVVVIPQWEARWGARLTGETLFRIVFLGQRQHLSAQRVEAERLMTELSASLRQQNRWLGSQAVQCILQSDTTLLEQFIRVIQTSDLDSLGTVMDDSVIQFLRAFLTAS